MLKDVLAVARPELEPAEDLHELLVELAAMSLEDGLFARLADEVVYLRLRLVVGLLDPRGVNAAVLEELLQRQLRNLSSHPVE